MDVAGVSIVIAAASVVAANTFYSLQIRNQLRVRKTDLVMRLYTTWDSLEFQRAFHTVYWADFHDYDSAMAITGGERQLWTYLLSFYDQVGVLLRRRLIEFEGLAEVGFERGFSIGVGRFPVHFGARHFGKRAPVAARFDGCERFGERRFVLRE